MRIRLPVPALLLFVLVPAQASAAEWQIKPFVGATFGGETTYLANLESAAGHPKFVLGFDVALIGEVVGLEADVSRTPGFFGGTSETVGLVPQSSVTTITGNIVVAAPRHWTEYTLRPYFVAGAGQMRVRAVDTGSVFPVASDLSAVDIGGGVTGFVTTHVGLSWDVRYFRSANGKDQGNSLGPEQLSFWRANMALAIRY
jgi:hypothetical protein